MQKKKKAAGLSVMETLPSPTSMRGRTTDEQMATSPVPKDLHDLLEHLEGYYGDDEGRFDATYLWPWRNLTFQRRNLNERILRVILKRLLAPKASLEQHWVRLNKDVQAHRRRSKASGKLARADAAHIVLNAVVDALLPVREASAKEMASNMRNASRAAAELITCLARLRNAGMNIEELLPTDETIAHEDEESGGRKYGGAYADARFFIYMKLPRSLLHEQRAELTDYALRVVMGDPFVSLGILGRIAHTTRAYKFKRHNVSGRQRFAYVMATYMVRDSVRFFGVPRYERAEAFTRAASGVQVKGLRQMMEREKKNPRN
ncbi:hypothetical protein GCM10011487_12500 [Steroidobacter agaridevorans]|uniref:Uncharacterized protein n=1 Tax=Steroidobacter agaridevorans TaxID=2695856 RepID=A0A829Y7S5_9GAMM|nr:MULTISPECIES: hypothetical protein [Steroidobacteraceae]GFE79250.1 hypothetical protein GCM10011487_12500 [Steroidobacter agaridevorans]